MLAYLDALVAALAARDTAEIDRLLAHPLMRILSPGALADATAERRAAASGAPPTAPLRLLQLRHLTAHLLGETPPAEVPAPAEQPERRRPGAFPQPRNDRRATVRHQMELPLSA